MADLIANPSIPRVHFDVNRTIQTSSRFARSVAFAQPLFDGDVDLFGYFERVDRLIHKRSQKLMYHHFYFMLQGSLEYEVGDKHLIASAGQIMLLPNSYQYKRIKISKNMRYLYFRILPTPDWSSLTDIGPYVRGYRDMDLIYSMTVKVLNRIKQESLQSRRESLEYSKMILTLLQMEKAQNTKEKSEEARVKEMARTIQQDLKRRWTLSDMSKQLSVSPSTLNRLCRKYYHDSAINLVIKLRIERSIQLLVSNEESIAKIARMVGYANASVFSNLFLKHTGVRPGDFRKNHTGGGC